MVWNRNVDKGRKACVDLGTHRHRRGERFELSPIATSRAGTRGQAGSQTCASAIILSEAIASYGDIVCSIGGEGW